MKFRSQYKVYRCIMRMSLLFVTLICCTIAHGQITMVEGHVREKGSNDPIPFTHIFFKDTHVGAISDTSGYFKIQINNKDKKADTLLVTYLGYFNEKVPIIAGQNQKVEIILRPKFEQLQEVTVYPGDNPAWRIMDLIVANKEKNNAAQRDNFYCEEYSKIRFDLNHFTDNIKQNLLLRPFDYIWEKSDTTEDGITYLPVLLVEKMIDHYYQRSPRESKDIVKAVNTTGLAGPKIMQFVEDLYLSPEIYNNFVAILDKNFISPIHDNYKNHYEYYLLDSIRQSNHKLYKIAFEPKVKHALGFTGEMMIDSASSAVQTIELRFDIMANVNFVRSYQINQRYNQIGQYWMLEESSVIGDFTVVENSADLTGFFGRKNSYYRKYAISQPLPKNIFKGAEIVVESDSAKLREQNYWVGNRHANLTEEDQGIFNMIEKLESDPKFIFRKNLLVSVATGYFPLKKFEVGDVYSFYSHNIVEHSRFKLGFRTSNKLDLPIKGSLYGAYGSFDNRWKYGVQTEVNFGKNKNKVTRFGVSARNDIDQLGRSFNQIEIDNVLTSFIQYGDIASRNYVQDYSLYTEKLWALGVVTRLEYFSNTVARTNHEKFYSVSDGVTTEHENFNASGVGLTFKYSWQNDEANGLFYNKNKKSVFRKYPDFTAKWKWADQYLFGSGINYQKINISLFQRVRTAKLGFLQYYIESGITKGTVPYPYLNIPFGNQLVLNDEFAFNLMNFLEFASDRYITVHAEQHLEGLLLDRIPLMNKLKWRLLCFGKAYWGSLTDANNQSVYLFPENLKALNKGYYEAGFGIENIFKFSRIDFTWRLTEGTGKYYYFIVKPSFRFSF